MKISRKTMLMNLSKFGTAKLFRSAANKSKLQQSRKCEKTDLSERFCVSFLNVSSFFHLKLQLIFFWFYFVSLYIWLYVCMLLLNL
jgi:hypothetical protein